MIEVEKLWKRFGAVTALEGISFRLPRGVIAGFLGPNGAGKSTTMRILTSYLPASRGRAIVAGFDVARHPRQVCGRVGYLPETVPLYDELRLVEYLRFRGSLRNIPRHELTRRIDHVLEVCELEDHRRSFVGTFSRGYRQRTGLADALLADPPVLILDEPTAGLDPRQCVEFRRLIEGFRGERTVLLSSHMLGEIEQVCDEILIITAGRLVLQDSLQSLVRQVADESRLTLEVEDAPADLQRSLLALEGVTAVRVEGVAYAIAATRDVRRDVHALIRSLDLSLLEMRVTRKTLEDLFLEVTRAEGDSSDDDGANDPCANS